MNYADQTIIGSYHLVKEVASGTTTAAPVAFPLGVTSGDMDLLDKVYGGAGEETKAYRLAILITAKPAGTGTVVITGAAPAGPEEPICSLAISIGGAVLETDPWYVVDTITLTSYHLAAASILRADSGNAHPCKVGFDAIGYRYINFYVTALTTITDVRIYARIL